MKSGSLAEDGPGLGERFAEGFNLAWELHRDQARKGSGIPYMAHLMSVAALVLEHGVTRTRPSRLCSTTGRRTGAAGRLSRRSGVDSDLAWPAS